MTLVNSAKPGEPPVAHVGELRLRRFRIEELEGPEREEVARHTTECAPCRARLRTLDDEHRQFEREIPFERFAGGVERAHRVGTAAVRVRPRRMWAIGAVGMTFAAAAAFMLLARPAPPREEIENSDIGANRVKGAATEVTVRIATADGKSQRTAQPGANLETLRPGERIRIGYKTPAGRHLVAVAIDDAGRVSAIYPEAGKAALVGPQREITYLPDSLELTGGGHERIFLVLSERPLDVNLVETAARMAHIAAKGDLRVLSTLPVGDTEKVQQFSWLFRKP